MGRNLPGRKGEEAQIRNSVVLSELKPESDEPGDKEIVITDVKVREIEKQGRFERCRLVQSIFPAKADGDQEARIVFIPESPTIQVRVNETDASLEVGFEPGSIDEVQGIFPLGGDADLCEIAGNPDLQKRADRNIVGEKVVTAYTNGKGVSIGRVALKTYTGPCRELPGSFLLRLGRKADQKA